MSDTYLRQWTMLRLIPRHPHKIDTGSLKRGLEDAGYRVDVRTIQRDLLKLSVIFPLTMDDKDKPYGWSWAGKDVFDLPGMDRATALTFALTERFLKPLLPSSSLRFLEPHFRLASNTLKKETGAKLGRWPDKVRVLNRGQQLLPASVPPKVVECVYDALLTDVRFKARYTPRGGTDPKEYEINPLGLVCRDAVIYLVCTLWDYEDIKQFALHRIQSAVLLEEPRTIPTDFDLDGYLASGAFGYPMTENTLRLKVRFEHSVAQHLMETRLSEDQVCQEDADGNFVIEATVQDTQELRWWLLGFGPQVEVLNPKRLREEFVGFSARLANIYSKPCASL